MSTNEVTMIALLPAAFSLYGVAAVPTITPAEAARHVGREVIVQGTVSQVTTTVALTTHINFGGVYPNHVFTATILKARQSLFTGVRAKFEGKVAQVQGTVRLYRGKPEIMIDEPSQLRLVREAAPSSAGPGVAAGPVIEDPRFDPRGADFADWVAAFKVTVGQQWSVVEDAAAGKVDVEFVVERDGSISALRVVESSGSVSLDRAAVSAVGSNRFLPLPEAYPSETVMMRVKLVHGGGTKE
jgi:TonB family protein